MMTQEAKEARRQYYREYRARNREAVNASCKRWRENNPEKFKASVENWWEKRAAADAEEAKC
jgi:hypothetical protein